MVETGRLDRSYGNFSYARFLLHSWWAAAHSVVRRRWSRDLAERILDPLDYYRNVEIPWLVSALQASESDYVLDLGSPKFPGLHIAKMTNAQIVLTDIVEEYLDPYKTYSSALRLGPERTLFAQQDGCALTYEDNTFDATYSVSVLEHIPGMETWWRCRSLPGSLGRAAASR